MGCDGGSIPKRAELVKTKEKALKLDKSTLLHAKFFHCSLSKESLKVPIVGDKLGNLYNKESILEFLLDRKKYGKEAEIACQHIKSLKDVINIHVTLNVANANDMKEKSSQDSPHAADTSRFLCPITRLELNGRYRFVYLKSCGCLLSEKALKEIPTDDQQCIVCGKSYVDAERNFILVYPDGEELEKLKEQSLTEIKHTKSKGQKELKRKLNPDSDIAADSVFKMTRLNHQYLAETDKMMEKSAVYRSLFALDHSSGDKNDFLCRTFNRYI
jgi:hypothetical protein